ncbi:transposable element Tcb1 transposase [Trichonephila clavipes]|nr:transposable element Tcb1 transposase [Trichonephila clavipes]
MSHRKQRSAFDQVSEFDRGRIVVYRDCGLSFREIGSRVGRNQTTVMRILDRWMQEGTTDRRGRPHPPQCTTSREDRQIVCMALTDRSVTSRTIVQHIESVTNHSVSARIIRRRLQQSGLSARRPLLGLPLTQNHKRLTANCAMKEGCGWQNRRKLSLLRSHAPVCNTTMVGFESGDTVE